MRLALLFTAIKLLVHVAANLWEAHLGWGYFRDEFYYIACGRHLAWGYVDHGPLVAVQARLSELLLGHSLAGLRLPSAAAGAARIFLTGLLCWSLGGRCPAQGLAMLGVLISPQYLGTDSFLSMNSFESLFWMLCLLAVILILRTGNERYWVLFGVAGGLGLLNKPSMTFFLGALLVALLFSPQRKVLLTWWAAFGVALLLLIALPNILWQVHNHWPTLEFLENGRKGNKSIALAPVAFVVKQVLNMGLFFAVVWIPGLVWLLRRREYRWLGFTFVLFFFSMMAMHAKDYYVSPIYPIVFAAGGIAWEMRFSRLRGVVAGRALAFPVFETACIIGALFVLPLSLPILRPVDWLRYTRATGLDRVSSNSEMHSSGLLPQFYADRFGWQEEVEQVTRVYNALPPEQRKMTGILSDNYGEAGAIDFLGHGLPAALSRHNNYYLWGPHGFTFDSMILIEGSTPEHLREYFQNVQTVGHMGTTYSMPFEQKNIYLVSGRRRKFDVAAEWQKEKHFF